MVDPHTCCVLDSYAIVVENTGHLEIADGDVSLGIDSDTASADCAAGAGSPNGFVGADAKTGGEVEGAVDDDVEWSDSL